MPEQGLHDLEFLSKPGTEVDLVVSDIVMPRMSGRELGAKLKEQFPGLPILFMSGYSGAEIKRQGLIEEGDPFLQKPIHAGRAGDCGAQRAGSDGASPPVAIGASATGRSAERVAGDVSPTRPPSE